MRVMCSIAVGQSFKNAPMTIDGKGNADALATTAKARQSEQGALKRDVTIG